MDSTKRKKADPPWNLEDRPVRALGGAGGVELISRHTHIFNFTADIYKQRWQVELFFKSIKGHRRVKSFYGTSANAVKIQVRLHATPILCYIPPPVADRQRLGKILQI